MKSIKTTAAVGRGRLPAALSAASCIGRRGSAIRRTPTASSHLSGAGTGGGQQTQFVGETFTALISGAVTNFQFTLNSSALPSLYGAIYAWNGSQPTHAALAEPGGLRPAPACSIFSPVGVNVTQARPMSRS